MRLEYDVERVDRHGRDLAGVFEGDLLVNAEIARHGLGVPVIFEPNRRFYDEVVAAYEEGKVAQIGMFSPDLRCTIASQEREYAEQVAELEARVGAGVPQEVEDAAGEVTARGEALLVLLAGLAPGSLPAAGLTTVELDAVHARVGELKGRADAVSLAAGEDIARLAAEAELRAEAEKKAAEEAEAQRKAEEEAQREAAEEAEAQRKGEEEEAQRKAAEEAEAQRQAEEGARVQAEQAAAEAQRQAEAAAATEAQRQAEQPVPPPPPVAPVAPPSVYYQNCTAARAAGAAPVFAGQPGYGRHLDRDGDGVGCEG